MFHIFKQKDVRNRAFVVDNRGNKLYYGTVYQCHKFIKYMESECDNDGETRTLLCTPGRAQGLSMGAELQTRS